MIFNFFFEQNHIIERMWSEINSRVSYPIKAVLNDMTENGEIDMEDTLHQYCVSCYSIQVSTVGINLFIQAWNNHTIPGTLIK